MEILKLLSNDEKIYQNSYLQSLVQWGGYLEETYEEEENEVARWYRR